MPQLGEAITDPGVFVSKAHNEKTCPWHQEGKEGAEMAVASENEDKRSGKIKAGRTKASMPKNDGGKLGDHMIAAKDNPPEASVEIIFVEDGTQEAQRTR